MIRKKKNIKSRIIQGDCRSVLKRYPNNYFHSIVTDPPYGLKFMNKKWDHDVPSIAIWKEVFRVLKPGGHLLSFGGTRTYHRMVCNIEDAGFEIMPMCGWLYGSGFPKSHNISKSIDKLKGAERKIVGKKLHPTSKDRTGNKSPYQAEDCHLDGSFDITLPATEEAIQWEGWGTGLKPAMEPICMARKPIEKGLTIAKNCLKWGTGGINIDECRIPTDEDCGREQKEGPCPPKYGFNNNSMGNKFQPGNPQGRFPANLIHDGSDEVLEIFPDSKGSRKARTLPRSVKPEQIRGDMNKKTSDNVELMDAGLGSTARFFYCAKPSKAEKGSFNRHSTVKPLALMEYLIKLITPLNGIVLDPFCGSGSTCVAANKLYLNYIGIDKDKEYCEISRKRIKNITKGFFPI